MPNLLAPLADGAVSTRSTPHSTDCSVARILTDLEGRTVTAWNGDVAYRNGAALTPAERDSVRSAIAALDEQISVPLAAETVRRMAKRIATMGEARETFDAGVLVAALGVALPDCPDAALEEATRRILAGEEPGISDTFMPKVPQIAQLTRRIVEGWRLRRDRLAKLIDLPEKAPELHEPSFTPDQMAAMRTRMERLARGAAARASASQRGEGGMSAGARVAEDLKRRKAAGATGEMGEQV